jgi:hypothetical protein
MQSTDRMVTMKSPNGGTYRARVWEGVTESGVPFVAYIGMIQCATEHRRAEFERDLKEHKPPSGETIRAIDARFIL